MTDIHAEPYQVLAPDSVAWHIQAALVADRTGHVAARDLALHEARRIATERQLTASEPGYDVEHEYNGTRLSELERQHNGLSTLVMSLAKRLDELETAHNRLVLSAATETTAVALQKRLDDLQYTVRNLQRLAQQTHGLEAGL